MLKMKDAKAVEVYVSKPGYLIFTTDREDWEDQRKNVVRLSYEQALILKDFFSSLLDDQRQAWTGGLEIEKADE